MSLIAKIKQIMHKLGVSRVIYKEILVPIMMIEH